jgi:hypothetical protein
MSSFTYPLACRSGLVPVSPLSPVQNLKVWGGNFPDLIDIPVLDLYDQEPKRGAIENEVRLRSEAADDRLIPGDEVFVPPGRVMEEGLGLNIIDKTISIIIS